jgi:glycosyltransferase involved in cell wall biosynthesis
MSKLISIVSPTYNEVDNINILYNRLIKVWGNYKNYNFELIIIDNASIDGTIDSLKDIASKDKRVKLILNNKNYGHLRSPYWGMLQAQGDAVIFLASDLQDPPEIIPSFIDEWERGYKVVLGIKPESKINPFSHLLRRIYYHVLNMASEIEMVSDATGFGLYDKKIMDHIREIGDPIPYFRGLVCELGYEIKVVKFEQAKRMRGKTKNSFYSLYDMALKGFVNYSILPIRMASILGFFFAAISFFAFILLMLAKIFIYQGIPFWFAVFQIIILFLISLMLIFIGFLGEYILLMIPYLKNRPIVIENERINF